MLFRFVWNVFNAPEAVSRQAKDYLVAYPQAEHLGFHSYDEYAGTKDVTVGKLIQQMPPQDKLASALRHSFFHRGVHIEELRNGKLHNVPLTLEHVQLAYGLNGFTPSSVEAAKTVGQALAENAQSIEEQASRVIASVKSMIANSK